MDLPVKRPDYSGHKQTQFNLKTQNLSYELSPRYSDFNFLTCKKSTSCNNTKNVLKNVNCEAKSGELTAIAGPSGAGKTTLLEILAGMIVDPFRVTGRVLVNDQAMNVSYFRRISGYVTQDEALFPLLTVQETLTYSARLRLKEGYCQEGNMRVQKLMKELGLDHIAGARIGTESTRGISGGEKRRVSIGVDLVHDPAVLLLDEPTSGLDSASAFHVISLLKSLAKNQCKTIVLTIHQPGFRILDLLDKVILLSTGIVLHDGSLHLLEERLKSAGQIIPRHVNVLEFAIEAKESLRSRCVSCKSRKINK